MLLRSSSTPILGSLLPSHLESPKHNHHHHPEVLNSPKSRPNKRLLANQTCPLSAGVPPSSPSAKSSPSPRRNKSVKNELRRAQSEGNLRAMVNSAWNEKSGQEKARSNERGLSKVKCRSSRQTQVGIESAPSGKSMTTMNTKSRNLVVEKEMIESFPSKMHLAMGLGVGGTGLEECQQLGLGGNVNDHTNIEEHYKKMVEENPCDSLYLRNYAQFLYQTKKDLKGAEEYYSRAILADPTDGDLLSQYGKLTWELHHDEERASSYFERAVQVAPEDSHVLAAYAGFLWETEEEEESYTTPAANNLIAIKA